MGVKLSNYFEFTTVISGDLPQFPVKRLTIRFYRRFYFDRNPVHTGLFRTGEPPLPVQASLSSAFKGLTREGEKMWKGSID